MVAVRLSILGIGPLNDGGTLPSPPLQVGIAAGLGMAMAGSPVVADGRRPAHTRFVPLPIAITAALFAT